MYVLSIYVQRSPDNRYCIGQVCGLFTYMTYTP
jgi:hypothetical protein